MLKLVDKPDLGSGALRVWVRVPSPAPQKKEVTNGLFLLLSSKFLSGSSRRLFSEELFSATTKLCNAYQFENSVPERGFSCTESTRGTVEGLLWYATCFQRNSVLKIGFYGTGEIFGTKNPLLWYSMRFQPPPVHDPSPPVVRKGYPCVAGGRKTTTREKQHRATNQPPEHKTTPEHTSRAQEGRPQYIAADNNRVNA